MMMMCIDLMCT